MSGQINDKYAEENEKNRKTSSTDDYEVYIQRYQEYSLKKIKVNAQNANDDTFLQKLMNRKWWVIGATISGIVVTGLAVGLPLHFKNNTISIEDSTLTQTISPPTVVGIPNNAAHKFWAITWLTNLVYYIYLLRMVS